MQMAYWVMVMMMVGITAPLSEGRKLNDAIRGLVPNDLTPQLLQSLVSRRHRVFHLDNTYLKIPICAWKVCPPTPWRRRDLKKRNK
uniref:Contulakin-Lt2 n=1 Tax=Conus litteratus TaxID=89445 RepID=CON2_CONLT|nr:RecName: Full=Contulakin-Lt2; Flags: Precursor [Conus litteratus]ABC74998.1 conotoxin contulakin lt2 precursor [Conus litteratus]